VIASFSDAATEALYHGGRASRFRSIPPQIRDAALRKLDVLDAVVQLDELKIPPGNHLEALTGDLAGFHSIRINRQWRLIFRWRNGEAFDVVIADYH
jgi:proteic killer suppression protein